MLREKWNRKSEVSSSESEVIGMVHSRFVEPELLYTENKISKARLIVKLCTIQSLYANSPIF